MDSLLLVIVFSGLCMAISIGMSVFILAASIHSSRISKMEGIDEVSFSAPVAITSDTLSHSLPDSLSEIKTVTA